MKVNKVGIENINSTNLEKLFEEWLNLWHKRIENTINKDEYEMWIKENIINKGFSYNFEFFTNRPLSINVCLISDSKDD